MKAKAKEALGCEAAAISAGLAARHSFATDAPVHAWIYVAVCVLSGVLGLLLAYELWRDRQS